MRTKMVMPRCQNLTLRYFNFISKFIIHLRFKCLQLELHMSNWILFKPSPLVNLPTEIWMKILTKMDPLSLTSLSMADSYFNHLTSDNLIWKKLYKTDYPARHSKMIGLRDVLKHISWKDSYNADSKVQIELRWANQNCVPCIRWVSDYNDRRRFYNIVNF